MKMIRSRFNYQIYMLWVIVILVASFAILLFINPDNLIEKYTHIRKPIILGLFILLGCLFIYLLYIANFKRVFIFNDRIVIKSVYRKKVIDASEIKNIDLFAHDTNYLITPFDTIITRIKLTNEKKIDFVDLIYKNTDELKRTLREYFRDKIVYLGGETKRQHQLSSVIGFEKYKGTLFTNLYAITILGLFIFVFFEFIKKSTLTLFIVDFTFLTLFYLFFGNRLHYFLLTNDSIVIKNHVEPWIYKKYMFDEIAAINFEHFWKVATALRITTKDFKTKSFIASSLRKKHWRKLKSRFKECQIHFVEVYNVD